MNSLRVQMTSSSLPPNLAVALNGEDITVDECRPAGDSFENSVQMSGDRSEADVVFQLDTMPNQIALYFPDYSDPASDLMDLRLYSRATCNDIHSVYQEISDVQISWEPVYANGRDCGVTSYTGDADLVVQ